MAADQAEGASGSGATEVKQSDVLLDTSEASRSVQKVELDLEDAPFLEEEEEVAPEPPKPTAPVSFEESKEAKPGLDERKKRIIIAVAALLVLVAAALAVKFFFFKGSPAPAPDKTEHAATEPAPDNATAKPELPEIQVRMEPFWVEQKGEGDEVRFLIVRMQLGTTDPMIAKEFEAKIMAARNAVFYYLKNKDVQFLADEQNAEKLKAELLLVINQYVTDGKFDSLMFEEYVVK